MIIKWRQTIIIFAIGLLIITVGLLGYGFGYVRGYASYKTSQKADFIVGLSEMEELRDGQSSEVISILEKRCYSAALEVLNMPDKDKENALFDSAFQKLIIYRNKYAKPEIEWSPVERRLVDRLILWQSSHKIEND